MNRSVIHGAVFVFCVCDFWASGSVAGGDVMHSICQPINVTGGVVDGEGRSDGGIETEASQ